MIFLWIIRLMIIELDYNAPLSTLLKRYFLKRFGKLLAVKYGELTVLKPFFFDTADLENRRIDVRFLRHSTVGEEVVMTETINSISLGGVFFFCL